MAETVPDAAPTAITGPYVVSRLLLDNCLFGTGACNYTAILNDLPLTEDGLAEADGCTGVVTKLRRLS